MTKELPDKLSEKQVKKLEQEGRAKILSYADDKNILL